MSILIDIRQGTWELIHQEFHQNTDGRDRWRRGELPLIDSIPLPLGATLSRLYVTDTFYPDARLSWRKAGNLIQYLDEEFAPGQHFVTPIMPLKESYAALNWRSRHIMEACPHEWYLYFEPVPWLLKFNLRVWRWNGVLKDEVIEYLDSFDQPFNVEINEANP